MNETVKGWEDGPVSEVLVACWDLNAKCPHRLFCLTTGTQLVVLFSKVMDTLTAEPC